MHMKSYFHTIHNYLVISSQQVYTNHTINYKVLFFSHSTTCENLSIQPLLSSNIHVHVHSVLHCTCTCKIIMDMLTQNSKSTCKCS